MGGTLNYEKVQKGKSENYRILAGGGDFPKCIGLYPDCPETPTLLEKKCRSCPKTETVKKPRLEWITCEFCKEEEAVPVDPKEDIISTKCHFCNKENSIEYIKSKR
ncbi:MAG: hypothetical protein PHQ98_03955 [Candidatus ainarchaeum sp.]|nr:hypothetical protein [Candidatus ainarchaeum sp.]